MFRTIPIFLALSFVPLATVSAGTAVLLLKDGGTLEGELLNPDDISIKLYRVKTANGIEINLDAKLVEKVQRRERESMIEYNRDAPLTENTLDNHLYWAKWCNEQQLPDQAKLHWQQVLEFDPDNKDARVVLGYTATPTGWVSQRDRLESQGFVQDRGRWRTQYQIDVDKILEDRKDEERYWHKKIRELCRKLPNSQAESELLLIRDPAAYISLREAVVAERNPQNQVLLLRSLARIPDARSLQFVAGWTIRPDGTSEDVRQICAEELQKQINEHPDTRRIVVDTYRSCLRPTTDPVVINMAAKALGNIEGYEAVSELIDVLVIVRTEVRQEGAEGYGFGSGGSGLSHGSKSVVQRSVQSNQAVLAALRKLTGVNFEFDQAAWREWYRQSKRSPSFNLRRN